MLIKEIVVILIFLIMFLLAVIAHNARKRDEHQ